MLTSNNAVAIKSDGDENKFTNRINVPKMKRQKMRLIKETARISVNGCFRLTSKSSSPFKVRNFSQIPRIIMPFCTRNHLLSYECVFDTMFHIHTYLLILPIMMECDKNFMRNR